MKDVHRRICVVGSGWHMTSGISYYTHRLSEALSEHSDTSAILMRRLVPRRLYPGGARAGKPLNQDDYSDRIPVFDGVDWYVIPSLFGAIRFLVRRRPDVVIFQWWTGAVGHLYLVLCIAARLLDVRVVIEFHEMQDTGEARLPLVGGYTRGVLSLILALSNASVVHSEFDQKVARATYPRLRSKPLAVIPHGPFDQYVERRPADERPIGESPAGAPVADTYTFLFFGTIRPYKGLEYLIEAFDSLPKSVLERARLLVVGEPWEAWSLPLDKIASSPNRSRIELIDRYVNDDEVAVHFANANAVVLPYTRSSASGPLHIAMSHGLPVLLSDVGGLRDGAGGYEGVTWMAPSDAGSIAASMRAVMDAEPRRFTATGSWRDSVELFDALLAEIV